MKESLSMPYMRGWIASKFERTRTANPYSHGSSEFKDWDLGWSEGFDYYEERPTLKMGLSWRGHFVA